MSEQRYLPATNVLVTAFHDRSATAQLRLRGGESAWFVLRYDDDEVLPLESYKSDELLKQTIAYWDGWVATIQYEGKNRTVAERSALAVKLLCYQPTGAIIASPTTLLPEEIGRERNSCRDIAVRRQCALETQRLISLNWTSTVKFLPPRTDGAAIRRWARGHSPDTFSEHSFGRYLRLNFGTHGKVRLGGTV